MATATSIQDAINKVALSLIPPTNIAVQFPVWRKSMFTPTGWAAIPPGLGSGTAPFWDGQLPNERTVFDWVIPTLIAERNITVSSILTQNIAINVVARTLLAVQAARAAGRITQDQENTVVDAFNAAF